MMGTLPDHMKLIDLAGSCSLTFECGDLPADVAVFATGHVPNGYFREGVVQSFAGGLLSQAELDPEAGMFCARGSRAVPGQLRDEPESTSTTPRGSPGSSGRQRPPASSSTTEHTSPRSISGMRVRQAVIRSSQLSALPWRLPVAKPEDLIGRFSSRADTALLA
jgi:hypothetical protein